MSEQRSDEWFEMRRGKFTASDIDRMLGKEGLKMTNDAIETYCEEKAVELVFGKDEEDSFQSADMIRGVMLEPLAFRKFQELKLLEFLSVEECSFFPFGDSAGASPDGIVSDDACLEIKCPRPKKFFNLVRKGYEAIDKVYISQMQFQMLCSNSKRCHFFNYIIFNGKEYWHEIIVERDDVFIEFIKERLDKCIKLRDEFVQYYLSKIN